jgi:hypothetical protein
VGSSEAARPARRDLRPDRGPGVRMRRADHVRAPVQLRRDGDTSLLDAASGLAAPWPWGSFPGLL